MKKAIRFSAAIVALAMTAIQITSLSAFAEEQTIYTGTCGAEGDNITWTYNKATKTITFSGTGEGELNQDEQKIPEWAQIDGYAAQNIVVEDGIIALYDDFSYTITDEVRESGVPVTVTAPNSLKYLEVGNLGTNYTVYAQYGSYVYYHTPYRHFVATGTWEDSPYATSGVAKDGAHWELDYETGTLTLSGPGSMYISSIAEGFQPVQMLYAESLKAVVIENDFELGNIRENKRYGIQESEFLAALSILFDEENWDYTIYYYKDNPNAYLFENNNEIVQNQRSFCKQNKYADCVALSVEEPEYGDLNMDGSVDLRDAVYMNKHTANIVQLTNAQEAVADCDGDGSVTDADVTTLMEYLMFQIPSLPYQA